MLSHVIEHLRCPHDGSPLSSTSDDVTHVGAPVGCAAGHRFDVARQGYVNLLAGPAPAAADTAAMVAARVEVVAAGHLQPLTDVLIEVLTDVDPAGGLPPQLVVDLGAGPGHHLAGVLDATGAAAGLAIDLSKHAARRAARSHDRVGAIVADAWSPLPVADHAADVVLVVFAPRQVAELARVVRPDGRLLVVTPAAGHLEPLVAHLGLLQAAPDKTDALDRSLHGVAHRVDRRTRRWRRRLTHADVGALALMGPSAHHLDVDELWARIGRLTDPVEVGFAVTVSTYRPLGTGRSPLQTTVPPADGHG